MKTLIRFSITVLVRISVTGSEITPAEYASALSIPMGAPSIEKMSCLVSSSPVDHMADITQAVFSRTWPRNEVCIIT